jgi:hypothetical protein
MKTYSVVIDFQIDDNTPNSVFSGLDVAFADIIFDAGGEVLNVSDYIDITDDSNYGEVE